MLIFDPEVLFKAMELHDSRLSQSIAYFRIFHITYSIFYYNYYTVSRNFKISLSYHFQWLNTQNNQRSNSLTTVHGNQVKLSISRRNEEAGHKSHPSRPTLRYSWVLIASSPTDRDVKHFRAACILNC